MEKRNSLCRSLMGFFLLMFFPMAGFGQFYFNQYFDGADTGASNSLIVEMDTSTSNIWQIGKPQKMIFDSAATRPNAIVTDTVNFYPVNNSSSFQYTVAPWTPWGIFAIQWMQKLDMDFGQDGGIIEFSVDSGKTWTNAFNSPYVYNFYGYDTSNVDTLQNGEMAFTGTDSSWKDIWLCFDLSWLNFNDQIRIRHRFTSDSTDTNKEGWMIDNMFAHITVIHTVNEIKPEAYMVVMPNPTSGRVDIVTEKRNGPHIIEKIELINMEGKVVQEWGISPTKFYIDISDHPNGIYILKVKTNIKTESFKIVLER